MRYGIKDKNLVDAQARVSKSSKEFEEELRLVVQNLMYIFVRDGILYVADYNSIF